MTTILRLMTALFLAVALLACAVSCSRTQYPAVDYADAPAPDQGPLVLGPGDEVRISVWRHDDMSHSPTLDMTGRIYLPLVGEIKAGGMTPDDLREHVATKLSAYVKNPHVTVSVSSVSSMRVHVLGEVENPGTIAMKRRLTLWDALASVGGLNTYANEERVLLIRHDAEKAQVMALSASLPDAPDGDMPSTRFWLQNNDIIYVTPTRLGEVERFMTKLNASMAPFLTVGRATLLYPDIKSIIETGERSTEASIIVD